MNPIPTKKLVFDENDPENGVMSMAFVDAPAIMVNWYAFSNQQTETKFAIQNEEQRIVFAPALIPDLPIFRKNDQTKEEFYVTIDAATIQKVAIDFAKNGRFTNANENHNSAQLLDNITIFESFITDQNRVTKPKGFENLPLGTWFIAAKVNNDEVWRKIKSGELNGFSIEGFFDHAKSVTLDESQIEAIIQSILSQ